MTTPLVEMDGDEMTRVLWKLIKDELLTPFIDLNTEYYDLGLVHRNETNDQVTIDSAEATKKYGVAVKCATITPNAARMTEYNLKEMYKSPNGTIRAMLDGTVFRAPIIVKGIEPYVKTWKKPITIARHAYGDVYKASEMKVSEAGKAELVFTNEAGEETRELIHNFKGAGVLQGMHNLNDSIESFARSCFNFALETKQDLWFATKDTISKKYDHTFKDIFQEIFDAEYKDKFEEAGITYFYTLIDDAVASLYSEPKNVVVASTKKSTTKKSTGTAVKSTGTVNTAMTISGTKVALGISLSKPVSGIISSRFGARSSIRSSAHTGLDIATSTGTPVAAAASGTVTFAGWKGSYGNLMVITHSNGVQTYYGHCSKLYFSAGATVSQGQTIAAVGSTGNSTGPHLHFEIRVNGVAYNPQNYLY